MSTSKWCSMKKHTKTGLTENEEKVNVVKKEGDKENVEHREKEYRNTKKLRRLFIWKFEKFCSCL